MPCVICWRGANRYRLPCHPGAFYDVLSLRLLPLCVPRRGARLECGSFSCTGIAIRRGQHCIRRSSNKVGWGLLSSCWNRVALSHHVVCRRLGATGCFSCLLLIRRCSTGWRLGLSRRLRGVVGSSWGLLGFLLLCRHLHMVVGLRCVVGHVFNGGWRRPPGSSGPVLCVVSCPRCIVADMVAFVVGRGRG